MNIQITNGKAFYEGCEVDYWNAVEVLPYKAVSDRGFLKDGTYPLPEGWDVVTEYFVMPYKEPHKFTKVDFDHYNTVFEKWPNRTKQTVRLIRKEQNSAHGYTEGSDITEQTHTCGDCGKPLTLVYFYSAIDGYKKQVSSLQKEITRLEEGIKRLKSS